MAYQKLQVGTGIAVVPSDTIDIPAVSGPVVDSTMSQVPPTTSTVVDATQDFTAIQGLVGSTIVIGTSIARVSAVASATSITLDAAIAGTAVAGYKVYVKDSNPGCVLYVGGAGNVRVLTSSGADLTFVGIAAGTFMPVQVKRVYATDTTATDIVALW
jgi:hypothetical protein